MSGLKMYAPFFDASGYAEAARQYALAIHQQGYPITLSPLEFSAPKPELGRDGEVLRSLVDRKIDYDAVLVHSTPDTWRMITKDENGPRKIGLTAWETTVLHPVWTASCNAMDEVWVPSTWNREVFVDSGVRASVEVFPHIISAPPESVSPAQLIGVEPEDFVFYSIFHWQERKNPEALLEAFITAFAGRSGVVLVIKSFVRSVDEDRSAVEELVQRVRARVNVMRYPRIVIVVESLDAAGIAGLHHRGDCFVLLQRAEGWGLPHFEAAAHGNAIVTTGFGGVLDFLDEESAFLVDYQLRPVTGMDWSPYYSASGRWASPNLDQAVDTMRWVFEHRQEAAGRGARAQSEVLSRFSRDVVGRRLVEHLSGLDRIEFPQPTDEVL